MSIHKNLVQNVVNTVKNSSILDENINDPSQKLHSYALIRTKSYEVYTLKKRMRYCQTTVDQKLLYSNVRSIRIVVVA